MRPDDSDAPLVSPVGRLVGPAQPLARGGRNIVHAAAAAVAPKDGKRFRAGERVQQFHADSVCAGPETSFWVEGMSGSEDEAEAGQHIFVHGDRAFLFYFFDRREQRVAVHACRGFFRVVLKVVTSYCRLLFLDCLCLCVLGPGLCFCVSRRFEFLPHYSFPGGGRPSTHA